MFLVSDCQRGFQAENEKEKRENLRTVPRWELEWFLWDGAVAVVVGLVYLYQYQ